MNDLALRVHFWDDIHAHIPCLALARAKIHLDVPFVFEHLAHIQVGKQHGVVVSEPLASLCIMVAKKVFVECVGRHVAVVGHPAVDDALTLQGYLEPSRFLRSWRFQSAPG